MCHITRTGPSWSRNFRWRVGHWFVLHINIICPLNDPPRHVSAAVYSARYISDRFLPDKAIDLVDEAASSLRLAQESKPDALEQLDRVVMTMQIELTSLRNESDPLSAERREALEQALDRSRKEAAALEERWQAGT
jgi:ATP-dependent Clp protease ATP-binding subunit ClpA